jgi:hypothetical protein
MPLEGGKGGDEQFSDLLDAGIVGIQLVPEFAERWPFYMLPDFKSPSLVPSLLDEGSDVFTPERLQHLVNFGVGLEPCLKIPQETNFLVIEPRKIEFRLRRRRRQWG